jgi:signal peptidase II
MISMPWMMPAIFNVADIFIVTGMISVALLVVFGLRFDGTRDRDHVLVETEEQAEAEAEAEAAAAVTATETDNDAATERLSDTQRRADGDTPPEGATSAAEGR